MKAAEAACVCLVLLAHVVICTMYVECTECTPVGGRAHPMGTLAPARHAGKRQSRHTSDYSLAR